MQWDIKGKGNGEMQNEYRVVTRTYSGKEVWKTYGSLKDAEKRYDSQIPKFGYTLNMLYLGEYTDGGMRTLRFMTEE